MNTRDIHLQYCTHGCQSTAFPFSGQTPLVPSERVLILGALSRAFSLSQRRP